ncbi:MAG: SPOR domain-containing protein [Clostridium sp.]
MRNRDVRYRRDIGATKEVKGKKDFIKGFMPLFILLLFLVAFFAKVLLTEQIGSEDKGKVVGENIEKPNVVDGVNEKESYEGTDASEETINFYIVQCGVFKNEANAKKIGESLSSIGEAFYIKSNDLIKVNLGMYTEENIHGVMEVVKSKDIDATKIAVKMKIGTLAEKEMAEIINANLKILNVAGEHKVESVDTANMKKWINDLAEIPEDDKNHENIKKIKEFSKGLEEKISRKKTTEYYQYIYNFIKELGYIK